MCPVSLMHKRQCDLHQKIYKIYSVQLHIVVLYIHTLLVYVWRGMHELTVA